MFREMLQNFVFILFLKSLSVDCYEFDPTKIDYCGLKCSNSFFSSACDCAIKGRREDITVYMKWFRKTMLNLHNEYRNKIARGELVPHSIPKSSRMMALNYDVELEYLARCFGVTWFEEKYDVCKMTSFCRRGQDPSQNIYTQIDKMADKYEELERVVRYWYETYNYIKPEKRMSIIRCFQSGGREFNMFTQLAWGSHTRVGCARVWNPDNYAHPHNRFALICNYAGSDDMCPGNIESQPVYEIGEPCRECRSLHCNNDSKSAYYYYDALCGPVDSVLSRFSIIEKEQGGRRLAIRTALKNDVQGKNGKGKIQLITILLVLYAAIY